jgi:hypothetical protein
MLTFSEIQATQFQKAFTPTAKQVCGMYALFYNTHSEQDVIKNNNLPELWAYVTLKLN